jgi:hypothetical protein
MDYSGQPVAALLRGPLLHTPQGIAVLVFSAIYLLLAALFAFADLSPPPGWRAASIISLCLFWPILLFLLFVKHGEPSFAPSWGGAAWLACCALAPVVFTLWRT